MSAETIASLIEFANAHDGGTPMPRAQYDVAVDAVLLTSSEVHLDTGKVVLVQDPVRSMDELRAALGY